MPGSSFNVFAFARRSSSSGGVERTTSNAWANAFTLKPEACDPIEAVHHSFERGDGGHHPELTMPAR